jgi:hypothetical protein
MVVQTRSSGYYRNDTHIKMPAGKYFVGDLQYVLNHEDFYHVVEGRKCKLSNGRTVLNFTCEYNMPCDDHSGLGFLLRSGSMGLTLLEGLEERWVKFNCCFVGPTPATMTMMQYIERVGHIVEFTDDFECRKLRTSHNTRDEHVAQLEFGDEVSVWWREGHYNASDSEPEPEDSEPEDSEPEEE